MMGPQLLEIVSFDNTVRQTKKGATTPLLMEFSVNSELAPFLVSSPRSVRWVEKTSQTGNVRAAIRDREGLERDIVAAVVERGQEAEWGNIHPLTEEGVNACVEHLEYYELGHLELLINPETDVEDVEFPEHLGQHYASWVPVDAVVVVPIDRAFLGTMGTLGRQKTVAVVHNASRGIAVAWR